MNTVARTLAALLLCLPVAASAAGETGCGSTAPDALKVVPGWMTAAGAPAAGRDVGIEVVVTITTDGRATDLEFAGDDRLAASGRQSVRNAVALWRFAPATRCGVAVAERVTLIVPMEQYATTSERPAFARNATDAPQRLPRDLP